MVDVYRGRSRDQWNGVQINENNCACDGCYWADTIGQRPLFDLLDGPQYLYKIAFDKYLKQWWSMCPMRQHLVKRTNHRGNGAPNGTWAGTLTLSPKDPYNEEDMVKAIRKIFAQKTCPVEKYSWYLEYTEAGLPHIHFIYRLSNGGRIPKRVFKRQWDIWDESQKVGVGHRGGYHALVHDESEYLKYISKDKGRHDSNWPSV
jgi:hypothetical protein